VTTDSRHRHPVFPNRLARSFTAPNRVWASDITYGLDPLKSERVHWQSYQTREEAKQDIIHYIVMSYNSHRLHSYLDCQPGCF